MNGRSRPPWLSSVRPPETRVETEEEPSVPSWTVPPRLRAGEQPPPSFAVHPPASFAVHHAAPPPSVVAPTPSVSRPRVTEPPPPASVEPRALRSIPPELLRQSARVAEVQAELERTAAEADALRAELEVRTAAFAAERDALLARAESELVRLALAVAERVVGRELATDPSLIVGWVREALTGAGFGGRVTVAVSPDVAKALPTEAWG